MNREDTKEELIAHLSESLAEVERAIGNHQANTVALYNEAKRAFIKGQAGAEETEWSRTTGLALGQLAVVHKYLFANSFMSAWYHMHGDKRRRDQAAQPACLLISGLGFKIEDVMHQHIEYELVWRAAMREAGIGKRRHFVYLAVGMLIVVVIIWLAVK